MFGIIIWLILVFIMAFIIAPATFFTTLGVLLIITAAALLIFFIYSKINGDYPPIKRNEIGRLRQRLRDIEEWEKAHQQTHPARQIYEDQLNTLINQ